MIDLDQKDNIYLHTKYDFALQPLSQILVVFEAFVEIA